jgi:hypothetical protein
MPCLTETIRTIILLMAFLTYVILAVMILLTEIIFTEIVLSVLSCLTEINLTVLPLKFLTESVLTVLSCLTEINLTVLPLKFLTESVLTLLIRLTETVLVVLVLLSVLPALMESALLYCYFFRNRSYCTDSSEIVLTVLTLLPEIVLTIGSEHLFCRPKGTEYHY